MFFHLSAVIANNLEWSKEKFLSEIKPFDFKILLKFFFEIGLLLNIFIFLDSQENSDKNSTENENENENKTEENHLREILDDMESNINYTTFFTECTVFFMNIRRLSVIFR